MLRTYALFAILAPTLLLAASAAAQTPPAARPDRGTMTGASHSVSDVESVSLTNGNVSLPIPLASLPPVAGGKLSWTVSATYNSKLWNATRAEAEYGGDLSWQPYVVDTPQVSDLGGWGVGGAYRVVVRDARDDFDYLVPQLSQTTPEDWNALQHPWFKVVLITPDGAERELRPIDPAHSYTLATRPYLQGFYRDTPYTTGAPMRYYTFDGTYISALINPNSSAYPVRWTSFLPDGTQVVQHADGVQRIKDTNGNSIKIFTDAGGTHYRDEQTGREIKTTYDPAGNGGQGQTRVWHQLVGGAWVYVAVNHGTTRV
jgi:hypothetical protein